MSDREDNPLDTAGKAYKLEDAAKKCGAQFKALGHYRGLFYFLTSRGKQVLTLKHNQLSHKATLFMLAPLQWWEREFPSDKGFSGKAVDQAVNYIIHQCYTAGVFRMDRMRGLGAWWDDGRAVIHAGDHLIVDNEKTDLQEFSSRYVYEALPALNVDLSAPMPASESVKFYKFCTSFSWERPLYGTLMAGWVTAALVCGAMPWRPHLFVTGPSGCGKSWVTDKMARLLGEFILAAKGNTSEAGLRQYLQHNALSVLFDEAEGEDSNGEANIARVLALLRQASTEDEGKIFKGGADGQAVSYTIRSMFMLSAIRVPIQQTADENRITVLTLRKGNADDTERFKSYTVPLSVEILTDEWASRFRARVIFHLKTFRKNIEIFTQAAGVHLGSARMGDQIGPMMAGAYLLHSDAEISYTDAMAFIQRQDWEDQTRIQEESDEDKVLNALLESVIRIPMERGSADLSVGELIRAACGRSSTDIDPSSAAKTLARNGILAAGDHVIISNTNRGIKALLKNTSWAIGWGRILKRIDGAYAPPDKKSFAGAQSRGVAVPIARILGPPG